MKKVFKNKRHIKSKKAQTMNTELFMTQYMTPIYISTTNMVAPITQAYFRQVNGLFDLKDVYPLPSCAIVEAIDLLHYHYQELKNKLAQDAIEDRKNG